MQGERLLGGLSKSGTDGFEGRAGCGGEVVELSLAGC